MKTYDDLASKDIWLLGEYPTATDQRKKRVLGGHEGQMLDEMLVEVGIDPDECARVNIASVRPDKWWSLYKSSWFCTKAQAPKMGYVQFGDKYIHPGLAREIQDFLKAVKEHDPTLIIGFGELALFGLTGTTGITNWRGSCLGIFDTKFIPTFSPERINKNYEWRYIAVHDLKRARVESRSRVYDVPHDNFVIRPSFEEATQYLAAISDALERGPMPLGVDVETRAKHITCIGIAQSLTDAICIPFVSLDGHYWSNWEEEHRLIEQLYDILTHPNAQIVGQNYIYDYQYIGRWWGIAAPIYMDTMVAWHVVYPGLLKSLAFISSMTLPYYVYWKDENHEAKVDVIGEDNYWLYNCKDCARTLALVPYLDELIDSRGLRDQYDEQMAAVHAELPAMLRGVNRDNGAVLNDMLQACMSAAQERATYLESFTHALTGGQSLVKGKKATPWYRSPTQQAKIFYQILGLETIRDRKTGKPTTNDDALKRISKREPMLKPICEVLLQYRSIGVFMSTFIQCRLDWNKRMYTDYGVGMAETFRNTSKINAFGCGGNMQNLPSGDE